MRYHICHLCYLGVTFALFAAPVCCPAAELVRAVTELLAAVENGIIARTTKEPRADGLFGFNDKSGFVEFRFTDNIIECEGTPRPLFRNDASGGSVVENNKLVNLTDTARYQNKATGKPQGPEQPLKFACGVNGELTVDGWKTRKTKESLSVKPHHEPPAKLHAIRP